MASPPAVSLRRNGTLQSCERCRKTKIKCDHSTPKCSRCLGKNLECVYEVAPMTRRFRAARFDIHSGRVRTTTRAQDAETQQQPAAYVSSPGTAPPNLYEALELTGLSDSRSGRWPGPPTPIDSAQAIEITTPPVQTGGFVGPGSYRNLTADDGQIARDLSDYSGSAGSPGTTTHTIDRKRLDLGLQIIDFVLDYSVLLQNLMHHIYGVIRMPIIPHGVMLPAVESLFRTIRPEVLADDPDAKLRTVVRIFQSSYQPIQTSKLATVDQVCGSILGDNLRWETIGNILAMASLSLLHIHARDFSLLDPDKRRQQDLIPPFHDITDTLRTLTSVSPVINELGVCFKYNQLLLALYRFGDSSQHLYSIFMELTSSIYATGMHQDRTNSGSDPAEFPGFMHQWRRRCFTAVYSMDKAIATTLGRPPLIHRNYCVLDAPLDFDDDDLTGRELEHELQKLDQHGWNTDGRRRSTSFMRLRYLLATVREEVLELHLGVNSTTESPGRAQIVLQKLQSIWNSCPDNVKYSPAVWNGSMASHDIWFLHRFYLDYLYSIFLIFRFNARQDQSQQSLELFLSAANNVLSLVLVLNEQRDQMRDVRSDFSAVFLPYGLPCADALAVELMYRPSSFALSSTPRTVTGCPPRLIRAEVIRDLTIYISCLSWMPGRRGHSAEFSREMQSRLTQILAQIIDAPLGSNNSMAEVGDPSPRGRESLDLLTMNTNHLFFDWDTSMCPDSQLDLFSQSLI
ncbi:hypothetical protein B0T24DRAFT_600503 [Lasiosphaeria ovina]|uniref:Zn(2)-C6 fungal-type domain-containing protein n=1 Tax=Lasiosphaeria ovina TaxID=92902 RepID=A0AAE0NIF4_9PEZI|nr:hypothetical protein B0T24DRAFT_600503 [Lasiosphaeria ovina]